LFEQRRIVDFAPGTLEDHGEHPELDAKLFQRVAVLVLQRRAIQRQERFPAEVRRHDRCTVVWLFGEPVRHLEKEQQRELLDIFEAGQASILQHASISRFSL